MSSLAPTGKPSLKVPRENNRFLCVPAARDSKELLVGNQSHLTDSHLPKWFHQLRILARQQALQAATEYLSRYVPSLADSLRDGQLERKPWVVGGHQPELFHPGVWFKNFLMAEIAKRTNSLGLQVIIDHDVAKSDTLRIPTRQAESSSDRGRLVQNSLPMPIRKESEPRMPWHATLNRQPASGSWDKTIDIVAQSMAGCGLALPLLDSRREMLAECISTTENIGDAFSQFRHRIEMEHGIFNLEVPIGHLCDASAFGLFFLHCVSNADSLWNTYNRCRDAYRVRHRIQNQGQPVLELQRSENWFELPFWIYRSTGSAPVVRNRLWVCKYQDHYLLSDSADPVRRTVSVELPLTTEALPNKWADLVKDGIRIRPRALMTTMYLRCFVADLFVHGIGGATYDELTDDILLQWLGVEPPTYLVSSASLFLPFPEDANITQIDPSATWPSFQRELHLMRSVPERFLDKNSESHRALHDAHSRQIASIPERGHKLQWHKQTAYLKQQIETAIEPMKKTLLAKMETVQRSIQQAKIVNSREYSFVLFEEQNVVGRLSKMANSAFDQYSESGK